MKVLYVVSDRPGAGKTAVCATLAHLLKQRGISAAVLKPAAEPDRPNDDDPQIYRRLLSQPAAEWLSVNGATHVDAEKVMSAAASLGEHEVLLVEGSTAVSDEASRALVEEMDAAVLLVGRQDASLQSSALTDQRSLYDGRLIGVLINGRTRYQAANVASGLLPELASSGLTPLGAVPEDRRLLGVTVAEIAEHLDGRFILGEEFGGRLLEHFLVGGLGMDSGESYFNLRDNKAVIIRGDRPDIQMAALSTTTNCVVLTNGVEPIEYVLNEAELDEVPIVLVQEDTLTTMSSLHSLQAKTRFDHPSKLERFAELLGEHVDLAAIYGGLGIVE